MTRTETACKDFAVVMICVLCFTVIGVAGCAGTPALKPVATATATSTEGDATSTSEADAVGTGAVKATTARDIRTFGLDLNTLSLVRGMAAQGALIGALMIVLGIAASIGGVMIAVVLPAPKMPKLWELVWWIVGTSLIAGPVIVLLTGLLRALSIV